MNLKKDSSVRKITAILYCNPVSNLQKIAFHNTKSDNTCRIESSSGEFRKLNEILIPKYIFTKLKVNNGKTVNCFSNYIRKC